METAKSEKKINFPMVLEATVIVLDNSEWMRNGDFAPSRMDAQLDAAHVLCAAKRAANVESAVAVMTMAGAAPQVLVTLTGDQGKLQHAVAGVRYPPAALGAAGSGARCNLSSALQVAQLVLKNRQNTNQHPRIVVFTGAPSAEALGIAPGNAGLAEVARVGRMLRKNGVALDIVQLAPSASGPSTDSLDAALAAVLASAGGVEEAFAATAASGRANINDALVSTPSCECHLLVVPPGCSVTEALRTSPVLVGDEPSGAGGSGDGFDGFDADMDPELAMALKLSLEEERARMQRDDNAPKDGEAMADDDEDDEEAMMARAIAMSLETASREHEGKQ